MTLYFTCGTYTRRAACTAPAEAGGAVRRQERRDQLRTHGDPVTDFAVVYDRNNTSHVQLQGNGDSAS